MMTTLIRTKQAMLLGVTLLSLAFGQISLAQGNSGNANGMGNGNGNGNANGMSNGNSSRKNIGVGNASDGISAQIRTSARVIYTGDPLEIAIRFRRGAQLINDGTIDASLVVFSPNFAVLDAEDPADDTDESSTETTDVDVVSDAIVLPIPSASDDEEEKLFEIEAVDISTLPAGTYQIGLILTVPGGDPLNIDDWYRGLLGLETIVGLTITDEAVPFDEDGDGEIDDDSDGDGFTDDREKIEYKIEFFDEVTGIEGELEYEVEGREQELDLEIDDATADTVYDIVLVFGDTDVTAGSAASDEDGEFDFELDSSDDDTWLVLLPEGSDLSDLTGIRLEQDGDIVLDVEFGSDGEAAPGEESDEYDDDDSEDEDDEEDEEDDEDEDDEEDEDESDEDESDDE